MTAVVATERKSLEPYLKDEVEFYPHQVTGVRMLARQSSFILGDDMGLGKSLQALTLFCIDAKLGKAETMIVVCPVSLRGNWAEEIEKFTRLPYVLLGDVPDPKHRGQMKKVSPKWRHQQLLEFLADVGPRILITNYEQLASVEHKQVFDRQRFDIACFDEAHYIKNPDSQRTKAALRLISTRSFLLTGTPLLNQVNELWPLLHRVNPGRFPKYWTYKNRYCVYGGYKDKQIVGTKNEAELIAILGEFMLRRVKKDVLTLPEPYYIQVPVDLHPTQWKMYNQVIDEMRLGGEDIENPLTKFLRLKQICGTPYSVDPTLPDDSYKLDRVVEIIWEKTVGGEKVVLFTQFRGVLEAIAQRLAKLSEVVPTFQLHGDIPPSSRSGVIKQWGNGDGPSILLCMLQVAGIGLNMTQSRTAVFVDKLFVPGLNQQAVDRLHRIGQSETQAIQVYELIARGTVEQRVEQILKAKSKLFGEIVEGGVGMRRLLDALKKELLE